MIQNRFIVVDLTNSLLNLPQLLLGVEPTEKFDFYYTKYY